VRHAGRGYLDRQGLDVPEEGRVPRAIRRPRAADWWHHRQESKVLEYANVEQQQKDD
jgi:hypothetical protein